MLTRLSTYCAEQKLPSRFEHCNLYFAHADWQEIQILLDFRLPWKCLCLSYSSWPTGLLSTSRVLWFQSRVPYWILTNSLVNRYFVSLTCVVRIMWLLLSMTVCIFSPKRYMYIILCIILGHGSDTPTKCFCGSFWINSVLTLHASLNWVCISRGQVMVKIFLS